MLPIATENVQAALMAKFVKEMESYTVHDAATNTLRAAICCVCDSIPLKAHWSLFVHISDAVHLFDKAHLSHVDLSPIYPAVLTKQYRLSQYPDLTPFVLSPESYVNDQDEILVCVSCHRQLVKNLENTKKNMTWRQPTGAIANGYLIGSAPVQLDTLNEVELALLSRVRIYCQSWIFYAGCHKQIQGWHTFFKNRPMENVSNLMQIQDSGMNGIVLVALCGPFTKTQTALTMAKTTVRPDLVIAAWIWLKANNFRYAEDVIPHIADIPLPHYHIDNRSVVSETFPNPLLLSESGQNDSQ